MSELAASFTRIWPGTIEADHDPIGALPTIERGQVALENIERLGVSLGAGTGQVREMEQAGLAAGIPAIVRVAMNNAEWVQAALDSGAAGVQIPQIATVEQAKAAVTMARFHPIGKRGFNSFVRAARYSSEPLADYVTRSNQNTALILQLESAEAVAMADQIAALPGVDAIFVGPYDLSQSMGMPGEVNNPEVLAAGQTVMSIAAARGLAGAVFVNSVEAARTWVQNGARWISFSTDTFLLMEAQRKAREAVAF